MNILVINGPNMNLLGLREPDIYGGESYAALVAYVTAHGSARGARVDCVQSNHEGALVDAIQAALGVYDGLVINPAAYTHTSVALLDAVRAVGIPTVEVHLTDTDAREPFRRVSYVGMACVRTIKGQGFAGYAQAIDCLLEFGGSS